MKPSLRWILAPAPALFASVASAAFHTFQIEEIYSDASGTVQYIVMHESQRANGENFWAGNTLTFTHAGVTKTFTFPSNLPSGATAGSRVLIATQGFAEKGFAAKDLAFPSYTYPPPPPPPPPRRRLPHRRRHPHPRRRRLLVWSQPIM